MTCEFKYWALSKKFGHYQLLLGKYCWLTVNRPNNDVMLTDIKNNDTNIALFKTRKQARKAQRTCCYGATRVERVLITIEVIK